MKYTMDQSTFSVWNQKEDPLMNKGLTCMFMILNILLKSKINISLCTYLIFIDHSFIC